MESGNFDLYLGEVTLTADFNLSPLLGRAGTLNYGGYSSAETDALAELLRAAAEDERPQAASAFLNQFRRTLLWLRFALKTTRC